MFTNKKHKKSATKRHPHKMIVAKEHEKVRLVLTCTEEEKMYIKMLAAKEKKTITDYLLSFARANMPKRRCNLSSCSGFHKPNELTEKVLKESERGENLELHNSIEDFWNSMGIDPNAPD